MPTPHLVKANGAEIPAIGLGTWKLSGRGCIEAVAHAISVGYRHIDTAAMYMNEDEVGEGLRASGIPRDQLFVTTKVWYENVGPGDLERSAETSLRKLGLDRVDLLLIHWPNPDIDTATSIRALCEAKSRGLASHIGVSNFPSAMVEKAVAASSEPLVCNQVEYHPRLSQRAVLDTCRAHGLATTSYSPLGRGEIADDPKVRAIAQRHGRTPGQIILRWHVQQPGVVAIPKSATPSRIAENLDVFDFTLTDEEMAEIHGLARPDGRLIDPAWAPKWDSAA
jgi:diketogulonate reductase-like aldo/keto reductase